MDDLVVYFYSNLSCLLLGFCRGAEGRGTEDDVNMLACQNEGDAWLPGGQMWAQPIDDFHTGT
jgi:hypothetical protein